MKVYRLSIDPKKDSLVYAVADVEHPAIESDFIAFEELQKIEFTADEEKMEVFGAALIPDKLMPRRNDKTGEEYYVYFTAEDIRLIAQEFFRNGFQMNVNKDHTENKSNSVIYQSAIVDHAMGVTGPASLNLPEGSLLLGKKYYDKEEFAEVKAGKRKGFSVEGIFQMLPAKFEAAPVNKEVEDADRVLLDSIKRLKNTLSKSK